MITKNEKKEPVTCVECKYLFFHDMYGMCDLELSKIVMPWTTCEKGERKDE